jgi:hypothetical protein
MGNTIKTIRILCGQLRAVFQEYDSANLFEMPGEESRTNRIRGWTHGSEVTQFTTAPLGAKWYSPSSPDPAALFDQIASNKGLTLRARPNDVAERLRNAEKSKTTLEWVELLIVEKEARELSNPAVKEPPQVSFTGDTRIVETVRLQGCRSMNVTAVNASLFMVTFKAASAEPRKRYGGGCDEFGCGSG